MQVQITITTDLEISNAAEVIAFLQSFQDPENMGLFVPVGVTPDAAGTYTMIAHEGMVETDLGALVPYCPEGYLPFGCVDYPLLLWEQALANKAKLEATGDPDDVHPDSVHLYYVFEDLSLGHSPCLMPDEV